MPTTRQAKHFHALHPYLSLESLTSPIALITPKHPLISSNDPYGRDKKDSIVVLGKSRSTQNPGQFQVVYDQVRTPSCIFSLSVSYRAFTSSLVNLCLVYSVRGVS